MQPQRFQLYKRSVWWYNVQVSVCKNAQKPCVRRMKKSIRRGVWAAPGTYRGIGQAMASTNRARKTNTKTNTRGSGQRGGRRRAKPKPDMNARWSILLFGIGVLVFALIVVPGASVWNWVRTNILFGVFGVGSYVLAPMLLYIAVLVACERPVKASWQRRFWC